MRSYRKLMGIFAVVALVAVSLLAFDSCKARRARKEMEARMDSAAAAQAVADDMGQDADSLIAAMNRAGELERWRADSIRIGDSIHTADSLAHVDAYRRMENVRDSTRMADSLRMADSIARIKKSKRPK